MIFLHGLGLSSRQVGALLSRLKTYFVCVRECAHVYVYVFALLLCLKRLEVSFSCFPQSFYFHLLRRGLPVNLELLSGLD